MRAEGTLEIVVIVEVFCHHVLTKLQIIVEAKKASVLGAGQETVCRDKQEKLKG